MKSPPLLDRVWSELRYQWRALAGRDGLEDELTEEVGFHLEQEQRNSRRVALILPRRGARHGSPSVASS
jgi:hypothetical protein